MSCSITRLNCCWTCAPVSICLPGALGQIRSLGKAIHAKAPARLLVIGLEDFVAHTLGGEAGVYQREGQLIRFVNDDAAAEAVLNAWLGTADL